jgi:signal transduction histidine kinase
MTLAQGLRAFSAAFFLLTALLGGLAAFSVLRWQSALEALSVTNRQSLRVERLRGYLYRQVKEVSDRVLYADPGSPAQYAGARAAAQAELVGLAGEATDEAARLQRIRELEARIAGASAEVFRLFEAGRVPDARALMEQTIEAELFTQLDAEVGGLLDGYRTRAAAAIDRLERLARQTDVTLVAIVLLAACQVGGLLALVRRRVVDPLGRLAAGVRRIGEGDLEHRLPLERADELGELTATVNRMAAALRESQARQMRAERLAAVGELAPHLAHNLRNPLASIRSAAQVAREELTAGVAQTAALADLLRDIIDTTDRLDGWVERILVQVRPRPLRPGLWPVAPLLEDLGAILRLTASRRGVALVVDVHRELPVVRIDRDAIEQVLAAVCANAIEASPAGGVVRIAAALESGAVAVTVADDGPGIPAAVRVRLFTPAVSTKRDGRGLGLWLARSVVESHGGVIELTDGATGGTVARVVLPLAPAG